MNRRQKRLVAESVTVIAVTAVAVIAMINLKDWVNRSEALRAMEQLGKKILEYRQTNGSVPPQSFVDIQKERVEGHVRLGSLRYRAQWIDFDATKDEILAYSEKKYRSLLLGHGYVVLRLDGRVEWMGKGQFEKLLAQQQSPTEIEMTQQ
ncbi:MAG: hypothetical protein JSU70_07305 [Phycisphaerales bacterium]|nr:MAG: hypothetical protein JSU70_07305 [Phycisphaerales bacterium]